MYNTALIILSFIEKTNVSQLNASSSASDYIVCADGGADVATQYGIRPDCVIGDFDSTNTNNRLDCLYITLPSEKDLTDTEAAINHAIELGISGIKEKYLYEESGVSIAELQTSLSRSCMEFFPSINFRCSSLPRYFSSKPTFPSV